MYFVEGAAPEAAVSAFEERDAGEVVECAFCRVFEGLEGSRCGVCAFAEVGRRRQLRAGEVEVRAAQERVGALELERRGGRELVGARRAGDGSSERRGEARLLCLCGRCCVCDRADSVQFAQKKGRLYR